MALGPMVVIDLIGQAFRKPLKALLPPQIDTTQLGVVHRMITSFGSNATADSWLGMQRALAMAHGPNGDRLYEQLFFGDTLRFQYPMSSLLPIEALSHLGIATFEQLNSLNTVLFFLNGLAVGWLAWLLIPSPARDSRANRLALAALAGVLSYAFYPLMRGLVLGQIQIWIDLLFTGALIAWTLRRHGLAGVLIGLACTIKPQLALLLVWGLLWREWRFALGLVVTAGSLELVSLAAYGWHDQAAYLGVLSFLSRHGESFAPNNSVNGILNWYLSGQDSLFWYKHAFPPFNPIVYGGTLAATLIFVGVMLSQPLLARARKADLADLGVAAICTIVASPVAWDHHYGLLMPLFVVAVCSLPRESAAARAWVRPACLFVAWTLTACFIPFVFFLAHSPLAFVQAYILFGGLILLGVLSTTRLGVPVAAAASGPVQLAPVSTRAWSPGRGTGTAN